MVKSPEKYEELRRQRLEENKKRMEELNLPLLSRALIKTPSPKTTPMKKPKPRTFRTELVPVRRSSRFTNNNPIQEYQEVVVYERVQIPRRIVYPKRDLSNRVYASDEARAKTTLKAEQLEQNLGSHFPTLVRPMLQSHVTGGFWLGLPSYFCKRNLPKRDETMRLVDECGEEWPTIYKASKNGLSGGWKKFAVDHDLVDGDALVFQLTKTTLFKVYIIRVKGYEEEEEEGGNNLSLQVLT